MAWARRPALEALERRHLLTHLADALVDRWDAEGEATAPLVAIRLETTDLAGQPITTIDPGSEFYLAAWVSDARELAEAPGVYSAYLDVHYDDQLLSVVLSDTHERGFEIQYGSEYQNGMAGDATTAGLIDEVGAFQTSFQPLGAGEFLLFRARFQTPEANLADDHFVGIAEDAGPLVLDVLANDQISGGTAHFSGDPSDVRPLHEVLLFRPITVVPDDALKIVPTELDVLDEGVVAIASLGTPSQGGSVWLANGGRHLAYQPAADFHGIETFTYQIGGQEATVTVVVEPENDAPRTVDDIYWTEFDQRLTVAADRGVLANDHDVEGDSLVAQVVTEPAHGTVIFQPDGSFEYEPAADFRGRDFFTYVADDSALLSTETTVRIDVGTPIARFRLEVADAGGQVVQSVSTDQSLRLRAWVKDLRDEYYTDRGISAAYLDVLFDAQLLQPLIDPDLPHGFEIQFGHPFDSLTGGDVLQPGLVNEAGATATVSNHPGGDEVLLFEMPFEVVAALAADDLFDVNVSSTLNRFNVLDNDVELVWNTELIAEHADQTPQHDLLLFDSLASVGPDQLVWENTSVQLTNGSAVTITSVGATTAGGVASISADGLSIIYSAPPEFVGEDSFTYTVTDQDGRIGEATVLVNVLPTWQNLRNRYDVNSDGYVSPIDALLVIYDLNHNGSRLLDEPPAGPPFIDVNGDGNVAPRDALLVISVLNGNVPADDDGEDGEGEGVGGSLAANSVDSDRRAPSRFSQSYGPPSSSWDSRIDSSGSVSPGLARETASRAAVRYRLVPERTGLSSGAISLSRILGSPNSHAERIVDAWWQLSGPGAAEVDWLLSRWDRDRSFWQIESALEDLLQDVDVLTWPLVADPRADVT